MSLEPVSVTDHPPTDDADEVLVTFRKPNGVLQNVTIKDPEIRGRMDALKADTITAQDTLTASLDAIQERRTAVHADAFAFAQAQLDAQAEAAALAAPLDASPASAKAAIDAPVLTRATKEIVAREKAEAVTKAAQPETG